MFQENLMCPIATHVVVNSIAVLCSFPMFYIGLKQRNILFKIFLIAFSIGLLLIDGYYLNTWIFG